MGQAFQPLELALRDHTVIGRAALGCTERMWINAVARVAHVVQPDEMNLPDIKGVVFRTPFAPKGVKGVLVGLCIKIEIMVAADKILGNLPERGNAFESGIERKIIPHDIPCENQALGCSIVPFGQQLACGLAHVAEFGMCVGLCVAEDETGEPVPDRVLDQWEVDRLWQGAGRGNATKRKFCEPAIVNIGNCGHFIVDGSQTGSFCTKRFMSSRRAAHSHRRHVW